MMSDSIGAYQAVFFEDVAQAVEYCHALVPHIVPGPGSRRIPDDEAVVWFHVPARSRGSTRDGCYLFPSAAAIAAPDPACLDTPLCRSLARAPLPADSVVVF